MNLKSLVKLIVPQSMVPIVKHSYDNVNAFSTLLKKNLHQRYLSLRLDTNNRCNLRCKYCYTLSHEREPFKIMTLDELKQQVREDLKVDDEHLDTESLKNQEIKAIYLDHKSRFELLLYKAKGDYK